MATKSTSALVREFLRAEAKEMEVRRIDKALSDRWWERADQCWNKLEKSLGGRIESAFAAIEKERPGSSYAH